ncbi:MAG: type II secretion system protein [Opitutaceae bacterium]|nr:type II secretion system protein [Opitutaceae bacterium]
MKNNQTSPKTIRAFTLIEVLIVIGLIAALASGVVMAVGNTGPKGRAVADLNSLRSLQASADRFVAEYGSVPVLTAGFSSTADKTTMVQMLTGTYTTATPAGLATWCQSNPVMAPGQDAATLAALFTSYVITSPTPRIVILQYRTRTTDQVVNANQTVQAAFSVTADITDAVNPLAAYSAATWPY